MTEKVVYSATLSGKTYTVVVQDPSDPSEAICECEAYNFRGQCRHQKEACDQVCLWIEGEQPPQTKTEREAEMCPRCWGPTEEVEQL